jgi:hypothetical protein
MGPDSGHLPFRYVGFAALLLALGWPSVAQPQPKVMAPYRPVAPRVTSAVPYRKAVPRSITGALWMIDANFKSTIYLTNNVETSPVTATPILFLSNGNRYTLPDVKLEPGGTAALSVNEELGKLGIASWANLTGYVEIQYQWPWDALCGMVQNMDAVHSLIFTSVLAPKADLSPQSSDVGKPSSQVLEGMWWKQEAGVTGFVALSNLTSVPRHVALRVSGNDSETLGNHSVTVSPHGTKVIDLEELRSASHAGGIDIAYDGPQDGVVVNGALEDPATGYSAHLRFARPVPPLAVAKRMTYAALGLMVGAADPMMSFPSDTVFTPYTVVRNVEEQPISVVPTLYWMERGESRATTLPALTLSPHKSQSIDLTALLSSAGLKNYNGMVNLILETEHRSQGLIIAAG